MDLGKVIGTVVATRKDPSLEGTRLLIVQPLDEKHNPISEPLVAVDTLHDAGVGETVYFVTGGDAVSVIPGKRMPVDVAIVGLVDSISLLDPKNGSVVSGWFDRVDVGGCSSVCNSFVVVTTFTTATRLTDNRQPIADSHYTES